MNDPSRLHITVFYLSHVEDPRPEPHRSDGGVASASDLTPEKLANEEQKLRAAVADFGGFSLRVGSAVNGCSNNNNSSTSCFELWPAWSLVSPIAHT